MELFGVSNNLPAGLGDRWAIEAQDRTGQNVSRSCIFDGIDGVLSLFRILAPALGGTSYHLARGRARGHSPK